MTHAAGAAELSSGAAIRRGARVRASVIAVLVVHGDDLFVQAAILLLNLSVVLCLHLNLLKSSHLL